ncbi:toll/interleukin-1 receptor domain-containing protein [Actinomadura sp. KC216]|uniref:toll/interleukin-1 receptor domain-containing protein n=1 Tax=Actinomadura sp. KC216 TaxID=2530370 RepID=UPI00140446C7|nr:toll/interleukin-1 receptor domain-containing protein [Actinomadura sp. KC216]
MANVFVSHRGADLDPAERLAVEIVEKINTGLSGSTYLVLCYSDSGVQSPWMGRE